MGLTPAGATKGKDIRKFEEIGTHPAANHNAIAEALTFHDGIGSERKAARLRYLRNRWADRLKTTGRFRIHTSLDPAQSCAIGTVQVLGVETTKAVQQLWEKWRIIATPINHAEYTGIVLRRTSIPPWRRSTRSATRWRLIDCDGRRSGQTP